MIVPFSKQNQNQYSKFIGTLKQVRTLKEIRQQNMKWKYQPTGKVWYMEIELIIDIQRYQFPKFKHPSGKVVYMFT